MSVEAKIRKAETKDILINEYMELDEDDIKNGTQYKIVIRKLTMKQQFELRESIPDAQNPSYEAIVRVLKNAVISSPFEEWNEEKIKWLDESNGDLLLHLFMEVADFNSPLAEKKGSKSKDVQSEQ